ncbi:hypothetical protein O9G_001807 [Rozella allomycis CSF55]|uniref:Uncharacterized protein n=1 Tax=Rozella allomycis (strain CSF55) TaxID=988480 RepID=A0A075B146_ROZAC|nr:hypothetical protein O9G_001807 [Rozella allomycis CSF55]|eukprot:EPZ34551.1 hypothetical protein O9G_001807 [Rozella allomycis CSF55]
MDEDSIIIRAKLDIDEKPLKRGLKKLYNGCSDIEHSIETDLLQLAFAKVQQDQKNMPENQFDEQIETEQNELLQVQEKLKNELENKNRKLQYDALSLKIQEKKPCSLLAKEKEQMLQEISQLEAQREQHYFAFGFIK